MKQLSTKSIASLLVATVNGIADVSKRAGDKHLERILQRRDRKCDLRAGLLGMTPYEYRSALKKYTFDELIRAHGFGSRLDFMRALRGSLIAELLHRGWSRQKINTYMNHKAMSAL